jgi:CHAT domain-containing protein
LGPDVHELIVVPDTQLDGLPFAALVDPESGRFLIEQRTIEVAPSVATFLSANARARRLTNAQPSVLVVSNSRPDREFYPDLPPLDSAAEEARRVGQFYARRKLLLEERATRDALLEHAGTYDVLHFAGHAVVNPVDPSRSSLALARLPGSAHPGALFAYELSQARFDHTRLVVLAACSTASGPESAGAGSISLARAFLAARVPTVVASLWPIVDGRTLDMMIALHAGLSRGEEPAVALRAAQLALLRSPESALRSPATWAAFQALGG